MDAHYTKVMKARDDIKDSTSRLYFAYSGVLDREAFEEWRRGHSYDFFELPAGQVAQAENWDLTFDFPSRWWGGRVAGLTEKSGSSVYGLLFEIPAKDWPVVQHKEGVITGMSVEKTINVSVNGQTYQATAFTTNPSRASLEGAISARYLDSLVQGARRAGLPEEYVSTLTQRAR